jgi:hypothetical protein
MYLFCRLWLASAIRVPAEGAQFVQNHHKIKAMRQIAKAGSQ